MRRMLYFLLHDADAFHCQITPALAASWRQRSFRPLAALAAELSPVLDAFADRYRLTADEQPLLRHVSADQPFDRRLWRHLAGEVLLYAAADAPELQTAPDTLAALLTLNGTVDGPSPIRQAHYGSRDLDFGGVVYRPDRAGLNDTADVNRLAEYLAVIDPDHWRPDSLFGLADDEERAEELAFARGCFTDLRDLYFRAQERGQVVVCEEI
jgi:hypothetical protein